MRAALMTAWVLMLVLPKTAATDSVCAIDVMEFRRPPRARALLVGMEQIARLHKLAQLEPTEQHAKTEEMHPAPPATADATVQLDTKAPIVRPPPPHLGQQP